MADYYPLITRAVAGLEKNTGEARRALYDRARNALLEQLSGVTPPLPESDIRRERLALEEAIRKVEGDAARRMRHDAPRPPTRATLGPQEPAAPATVAPATRSDAAEAPTSAAETAGAPGDISSPAEPEGMQQAAETAARAPEAPNLAGGRAAPAPPDGEEKLHEAAATAESLGEAAAPAATSTREADVPAPSPEFERPELRLETEAPRPPAGRRPERPAPPRGDLGTVGAPQPIESPYRNLVTSRPLEPPVAESVRTAATQARRALEAGRHEQRLARRLLRGVLRATLVMALIFVVGAAAYWQRDNILIGVRNIVSLARAPSAPPPREATPARAKIPDRIGQATVREQPSESPAEAPVAQRVVLYEEDPYDAAGKRYIGTVVWRLETVPPEAGQPMDRSIRADITIPERNMTVTWSLRRNTDKDLPASHMVSIMFTLPADFPHGGIAEIRGLLMKQAEQTRGTSLAGLSVKVTTGFFLIGLSSADGDLQRNIQMLKERSWFDVAIVYNDNRRAILAVEKGTPGERVFADAFAAWGQ